MKLKYYWISLMAFYTSLSLADGQNKNNTFWELGVGLSSISTPQYTGSEQREVHTLPFPFFSYESEKLSMSREGVKRQLIESNRWSLDLSFAGTFPVDSDESDSRQGMPDLDWVALGGPALNYSIYQNGNDHLKFMLPLRFGISTDFKSLDYAGWESVPTLRWSQGTLIDQAKWEWFFDISLFYTSSRYNNYIYSVDEAYSTPERPTYKTSQGHAGYEFFSGVTRREGRLWLGAFMRYRGISDAVFSDSPLVQENDNYYAGVAIAWIIHSSE